MIFVKIKFDYFYPNIRKIKKSSYKNGRIE